MSHITATRYPSPQEGAYPVTGYVPVVQFMLPCELHSAGQRADARSSVLSWARRKGFGIDWSTQVPADAFDGAPFEVVGEGARIRVTADGERLWHFDVEHMGTGYAPRMWKLEAFVADRGSHDAVGVRVACEHRHREAIPSNTPGLVRTFVQRHVLMDAGVQVSERHDVVEDGEAYERFLRLLLAQDRALPVVAVSQAVPRRGEPQYVVQPVSLARALQGLAHVVAVPSTQTFRLTADLGRELSVFGGAVRTYMPGFSPTADKRPHFLYLAERVRRAESDVPFEDALARRLRSLSVDTPERLNLWPQVGGKPVGRLRRALSAFFKGVA